MFYKDKSSDPEKNFKNPPREYRSMPFWAWNCRLENDELARQIGIFDEMGFGGFFMHPRSGLDTKYLSDEFFDSVKHAVNEAKSRGMYAGLYDEDRYSSGPAGGLVTADPALRERIMILVPLDTKRENSSDELLGYYEINFDPEGFLEGYSYLGKNLPENSQNVWKLISTTENRELVGWWGGDESFIDTLNLDAARRFTEISHEKYRENVGHEFGKTCPMIFSDELQHAPTSPLPTSDSKRAALMYTKKLFDEFESRRGYRLEERLPEVIWNLKNGDRSVRYDYHRVISELFHENYSKVLADWCRKNDLPMTAHMSMEESLSGEITRGGDIFACLAEFDLPGVDVLGSTNGCPLTLLRTRSAARQFGREGMMSELFGVTGWLYSFREYKRESDFQAALGVTLRVPHLAWVSMKGVGKRDYPASIGSQSTWYPKFRLLEDHFARISSILTRGKAAANVGVIHPVESIWRLWGPDDKDSRRRSEIEKNYRELLESLLRAHIEFDLISESTPADLSEYETIIIPDSLALRDQTLEKIKSASRVLTLSADVKPDFAEAVTPDELIGRLGNQLLISEKGSECRDYVSQHRIEGDIHWIFAAPYSKPNENDRPRDIEISLVGKYKVDEFDTLNGEIIPLHTRYENGRTTIEKRLDADDSLLLRFTPGDSDVGKAEPSIHKTIPIDLPDSVGYELTEPNALLLDMAEISLDGRKFQASDAEAYLLDISKKVREELGYPNDRLQPYKRPDLVPEHSVTMDFRIDSSIEAKASLALEFIEGTKIHLNGEEVSPKVYGFFADKSIKTIRLPKLRIGENHLSVTIPFGLKTTLEPMYLLGDFGVYDRRLGDLPEKLRFTDISAQGLPFYTGDLIYKLPIKAGRAEISLAAQPSAVYAEINGVPLCFAPFKAEFTSDGVARLLISPGRQNVFGALHNKNNTSGSPETFFPSAESFSEKPITRPRGIIGKPDVRIW